MMLNSLAVTGTVTGKALPRGQAAIQVLVLVESRARRAPSQAGTAGNLTPWLVTATRTVTEPPAAHCRARAVTASEPQCQAGPGGPGRPRVHCQSMPPR